MHLEFLCAYSDMHECICLNYYPGFAAVNETIQATSLYSDTFMTAP